MNQDMLWQIVRYLLLAGGGSLVSGGITTQANLQTAVGAVITVVSFVWGCYVKWETRSVPENSLRSGTSLVTTPVTGTVVVHR